jgi:hypothetical protein
LGEFFFVGEDNERESNISRARDPVHAGDKALKWETPVQRGRVNRYVLRIEIKIKFPSPIKLTYLYMN